MKFRIKDILREKCITALALAGQIDMTQANLSNIMTGKTTPSLGALEKIAQTLEVPITDLFETPTTVSAGAKCPNCGASLEFDVRVTDGQKTPDHENIRGTEYYK